MTHRTGDYRSSQIGGKTGLGSHLDAGGMDQAVIVESDIVAEFEAVTLAGYRHVIIAVEAQLDRAF